MAETLASIAVCEKGDPSLGQGEGQKKEWSVLGLGVGLEKVSDV